MLSTLAFNMENSPELSGKYLGIISTDFVKVADILKEAAYQIKAQGFSEYPIFPVCRTLTEIGSILIPKERIEAKWNFNISYIDEFTQRQLIAEENLEQFKNIYKDPEEFCCLFVIDMDFTNFIFIPYPEDL